MMMMMMMMMCKRFAQVPMLCVPIYSMKLAMMGKQTTPIFTTLSAHTKMTAEMHGQDEVFGRSITSSIIIDMYIYIYIIIYIYRYIYSLNKNQPTNQPRLQSQTSTSWVPCNNHQKAFHSWEGNQKVWSEDACSELPRGNWEVSLEQFLFVQLKWVKWVKQLLSFVDIELAHGQMEVSWNGGTPKSSQFLMGFSHDFP